MGLIRNIASFSVALGVWAVVYPMAIQWSLDGLMEKRLAMYDEMVKLHAVAQTQKELYPSGVPRHH
ncbi:hypothetical protein HaLaN_07062, partial [Haematococcus lacustris]